MLLCRGMELDIEDMMEQSKSRIAHLKPRNKIEIKDLIPGHWTVVNKVNLQDIF